MLTQEQLKTYFDYFKKDIEKQKSFIEEELNFVMNEKIKLIKNGYN